MCDCGTACSAPTLPYKYAVSLELCLCAFVLWDVGPMADPWEVILESLVAMNGKSAAPMRRRIQLAIKYLSGNSELKAALTAVGCSKGALGHSHTFSTATTALPVLCLALTHRHTVSTLAHHPWRICVCVCVCTVVSLVGRPLGMTCFAAPRRRR